MDDIRCSLVVDLNQCAYALLGEGYIGCRYADICMGQRPQRPLAMSLVRQVTTQAPMKEEAPEPVRRASSTALERCSKCGRMIGRGLEYWKPGGSVVCPDCPRS